MQPQARRNPVLLATSALVVAAALAAPRAHAACGQQHDFLVRADPLLATVRPADCATLLGGPPEFTWPLQRGQHMYTVALRFPDGHTETRTTDRNWLAWNEAVPAGEYTWRVSVAGRESAKSDARLFRVEKTQSARNERSVASSRSSTGREGAAIAAPAASLFRLEPAESWIPSVQPAKTARKPAVGAFFGGFTQ